MNDRIQGFSTETVFKTKLHFNSCKRRYRKYLFVVMDHIMYYDKNIIMYVHSFCVPFSSCSISLLLNFIMSELLTSTSSSFFVSPHFRWLSSSTEYPTVICIYSIHSYYYYYMFISEFIAVAWLCEANCNS